MKPKVLTSLHKRAENMLKLRQAVFFSRNMGRFCHMVAGVMFSLVITGSVKITRKSWSAVSASEPQFRRSLEPCKGYKCNRTCFTGVQSIYLRCCPGNSSLYDTRTQICCGGRGVHAITSSHNQACCSDQVYSRKEKLCCDGQLRALYDSRQRRMRCCGQNSFNPLTKTCCNGIVTKGIEDGRCCRTLGGVLAYDPISHLCCRASNRSELWFRGNGTKLVYCCGTGVFEPSTSICCAGNIMQRVNVRNVRPQCCGAVVFDATNELCCGGKQILKNRHFTHAICCGEKLIDGAKKICCLGREQSAARGKISCCGGKSYNSNKDTCCLGKINSNVAFGRCCGKQAYLSSQSTCCEDQITHVPSIRETNCCGSRGYEPSLQMCCGEKLVELRGTNLSCCCGDLGCKTFKPGSQVCCSNSNVIKRQGEQLCCAGVDFQRLYDPKTETCCKGSVSKTTERNYCCGNVPYTTRIHRCCHGYLHSRAKGSRCCNTELFNPNNAFCTNGMLGTLIRIPPGHILCKTTPYDPKKKLCCSGFQLSDRIYGSAATACCGGLIYTRNTHCCCRGKLHLCPAGKPHCCYTKIFDQLTQTCNAYTGEILDKFQPRLRFCGHLRYDPANLRCCGNRVYGANQMCCRRKVLDAPGVKLGQGACCNGRPYSKDTQLCCHGNIWPKGSNPSCCGYRVYDTRDEACCGGKVFTAGFTCCRGNVYWTPGSALGTGGCCNGIGFNRETQICCGDKVFSRTSPQVTCCGGFPYDPSKRRYLCCHGNLAMTTLNSTETLNCCGEKGYDSQSETCCNGRVFKAAKGKCCGNNLINRSDDICCDGKALYMNSGAHKLCCGAGLYNTRKEFCAWNSIIRSRKLSPCGMHFYKNSTQLCCAGEIFAKHENDRCCSAKKYDRRFSICCDEQVFPKSNFACFDQKPCRTNGSRKCCRGEMSPVRQQKCMKKGSVSADRRQFREFRKRLCSSGLVFLGTYSSTTSDGSLIFANVSILKPGSRTKLKSYTVRAQDYNYFPKSGRSLIVAGSGGTGDIMTAVSASLLSSRKALRKTKKVLKRCPDS